MALVDVRLVDGAVARIDTTSIEARNLTVRLDSGQELQLAPGLVAPSVKSQRLRLADGQVFPAPEPPGPG